MRTRVTSRLPANWKGIPKHGRLIAHAADVRIAGSRLRLKVLVFRTNRDMRRFWQGALGLGSLCDRTQGAVNKLDTVVFGGPNVDIPVRREVDRRYYAVMALVAGHGTTHEVVVHESVHAAYAFALRLGSKSPYVDPDMDEEAVAYPAGKIAAEVTRWLRGIGQFTEDAPARAA